MKKKQKRQLEPVNYWESSTDMMSALVLVIILFLMLLLLNLFGVEEQKKDDYEGIDDIGIHDYIEYLNHSQYNEPTVPTYPIVPVTSGGGGSGGGDGDATDKEFEDRFEGVDEEGIYLTPLDGKDAVLVNLIDAETNRFVRETGATFELYTEQDQLVVLSTYYPNPINYRSFTTAENGSFYLPEKISSGTYRFHELESGEGYDPADDVSFSLDETYDWDDPYIVNIPVYPCRNVIHVNVSDSDTGSAIGTGTFDVFAADDIITKDGTTRYEKGERVATITYDENGEGQSEELYLGNYILCASTVPSYYVKNTEDIPYVVLKKGSSVEDVNVNLDRTKVNVKLTNEENNNSPITNVSFILTIEGNHNFEKTYVTDFNGSFVIDSFEKGKTYHLKQEDGPWHDVATNNVDHVLSVDNSGFVNGMSSLDLNLTNRILHIRIDAVSAISKRHLDDLTLTLYDASNNSVVASWNTRIGAFEVDNLHPGEYYVTCEQISGSNFPVTVRDEVGIQNIKIQIKNANELFITYASGTLLFAAIITFSIIYWRNKKRKGSQKR